MSEIVQTILVSAVALGAGAVVVFRIVSAVRPPKKGAGGCASCAIADAMTDGSRRKV